MTTSPTVLLAQVVKLVGPIEVDVTDSLSSRTVTLVGAGVTTYGRIYLAASGATGTTASTPYDILDAFEDDHFKGNEANAGQHRAIRQPPLGGTKALILDSNASGAAPLPSSSTVISRRCSSASERPPATSRFPRASPR